MTKAKVKHARGRGKSKYLGFWVGDDVMSSLKERAEQEGRPVSNLVRLWLMERLKSPPRSR